MPRPDDNQRVDLAELGNARRWDAMIVKAMDATQRNDWMQYTLYERDFIKGMIQRNDNDRPLWSPTRKQYNMLHTLVSNI